MPHPRGTPPLEELWPHHLQQQIIRLAIAPPLTWRELAQMVRDGSHVPVEDRGIQRILEDHHLSHNVLPRHDQSAQPAVPPPGPQRHR